MVPGTESTPLETLGTEPTPAEEEQPSGSLRQLLLAPGIQLFDSPSTAKPEPQDELQSEITKSVVYSGTGFVKAPPRHVADTWLKLYKITGYPQTKPPEEIAGPLVEHFAEVAQAALRETPEFTPDERDIVQRAIDRTIADSWTLRALPIAVLAETTPAAMVELTFQELAAQPRLSKTNTDPSPPAPPPPRARIVTAESLGWQMALPRRGRTRLPGISRDPWIEELPSPGRLLPDNTVSALILYHDLLTTSRERSAFFTPLLTRSNLRVDLATTEWQEQELVSFPWPTPPARTFFNLDRFISAWNEAIKNEDVIGESELIRRAERLAFAWLSAGTAVVIHQDAIRVPGRSDDVPWPNLAEQLNQAAIDGIGGHKAGYREWLLRALELLMPEMGMAELELQQNLLKIFNAKKKLMGFWQENRPVLQQRRAERLARLSGIDAVLAERLRASKKGLAGKFIPDKKRVEGLTRPGRRQQPDQDGTGGLS